MSGILCHILEVVSVTDFIVGFRSSHIVHAVLGLSVSCNLWRRYSKVCGVPLILEVACR